MFQIKVGFRKLYTLFIIIIFASIVSAFFINRQLSMEGKRLNHIQNEMYPYVALLNRLNTLLTESKLLITSWIYLPDNYNEKEQLKIIHHQKYPALKQALLENSQKHQKNLQLDSLYLVLREIDTLLNLQKIVMNELLVSTDDYSNPEKMFTSNDHLISEIYPKTNEAQRHLKIIIIDSENHSKLLKDDMLQSFGLVNMMATVIGILFVLIIAFVGWYVYTNITKPVLIVKNILLDLSVGKIDFDKPKPSESVIAEMLEAVKKLTQNFTITAQTASEIGKGNFEIDFQPLGKEDILGKAILGMKQSLNSYSQEMEQKVTDRTMLLELQNQEIQRKNDDIIASINYALRIQNAIIPKESDLQKHFDCFVFFRPRDIVSGDFYWFADKGTTKILAVADCTGHGVSGAFMTMIGNNILNQIVHNQEIHEPNEILNQMPILLEKTLLHSEGKVKDGMDISILTFENAQTLPNFENLVRLKVSYAGAMNPLYYVQNQEFREIKADKRSIGGEIKENFLYQKHDIWIEGLEDRKLENPQTLSPNPCTLYLCSDGFQDQFGGTENRKFMVKKLKNLLFEISEKPMNKQKEILETTFNNWKGNYKQTDDVMLIGLRF